MKNFIISALSLFIATSLVQCQNYSHGGTDLHELAQDCFFVRPKCRIDTMLDHDAIDPFIKDKKGYTAREIAIQGIEKKRREDWYFCEHLAEELEEYEQRFHEKMKQNVEQKKDHN